MTESIWTWGSIIDALGGTGAVATGLGETPSTISGWRKRPRGIPGERWSALIRFAAEVGKPEITLEVLADVAARRTALDCAEARA